MSGSLGSIVTPLVPLSGTSAASCSSSPASGLPQPSDTRRFGPTTATPKIRPTVWIICRRDMRPSSYSSTISSARYRLSRQESFKTASSPGKGLYKTDAIVSCETYSESLLLIRDTSVLHKSRWEELRKTDAPITLRAYNREEMSGSTEWLGPSQWLKSERWPEGQGD